MSLDDFNEKLGNVREWSIQSRINQALGVHALTQNYPVYMHWNPRKDFDLIREIRTFVAKWFPVILRQIYYHLVSTQQLPEAKNSEEGLKHYKIVEKLVKFQRLSGDIDFSMIVDQTRHGERAGTWNSIQEVERAVMEQYRTPWIDNQPCYIEVFLEKRALRNFFYPITNSYGIYLNVGGGFTSWDAIYNTALRYKRALKRGQDIKGKYYGDLNASGKSMIPDIKRRLKTLGVRPLDRSDEENWIEECALSVQDVRDYDLPVNPAKMGDTRAKWFAKAYPDIKGSVELDALPPQALRSKLKMSIEAHLDLNQLLVDQERDRIHIGHLKEILDKAEKEEMFGE